MVERKSSTKEHKAYRLPTHEEYLATRLTSSSPISFFDWQASNQMVQQDYREQTQQSRTPRQPQQLRQSRQARLQLHEEMRQRRSSELSLPPTSSPLVDPPAYKPNYGYHSISNQSYVPTPNRAVARPAHRKGLQPHTFLDPQYYYAAPRPPHDPQTGYAQPPFGFFPLVPHQYTPQNARLPNQGPHAYLSPTPARNPVADNITTVAATSPDSEAASDDDTAAAPVSEIVPPSSPPHESLEIQAAHILLRMRSSTPIPLSRRGSPVTPEVSPITGSEDDQDTEEEMGSEIKEEMEVENDDEYSPGKGPGLRNGFGIRERSRPAYREKWMA